MAIKGDMRKAAFRGRQFVYAEIRNYGFLPDTELVLHSRRPSSPEGYVVRMHKETVKQLRRFDSWKRGAILMQIYQDRPRAA